jgi:putative ABC transport system ATP-binding protein
MSIILEIKDVSKTYKSGNRRLTVLDSVSLKFEAEATCAVVGPSGSGKTTFLGLCAGLDTPSTGSVILNGHSLVDLDEDERARIRNENVGFIFQNFQLIATLTALENVMVPLELRGERGARERAVELLSQVGLGDRLGHYPVQLSGGEQQRVALARAFINQPAILFADEPTGNLDAETSEKVQSLLFELNVEHGTTLIMATHDSDLAAKCERIVRFKGGRLVHDDVVVDRKEAVS